MFPITNQPFNFPNQRVPNIPNNRSIDLACHQPFNIPFGQNAPPLSFQQGGMPSFPFCNPMGNMVPFACMGMAVPFVVTGILFGGAGPWIGAMGAPIVGFIAFGFIFGNQRCPGSEEATPRPIPKVNRPPKTEPPISTGDVDLEKLKNKKGRNGQTLYPALLEPGFYPKLQKLSQELGIEPEWLLAVMINESSLNPKSVNRNSNTRATGLIQFTRKTAQGLGTTVEALEKMSATEQLDYVKKYLAPYKGRMKTPGDVYMSVFLPSRLGEPDNTVIGQRGQKIYDQNPSLDFNKDGTLTVGDVKKVANQRLQNDVFG